MRHSDWCSARETACRPGIEAASSLANTGAGIATHTQLVGRQRPINEVADLLGHRSINTTALYVKVAASQLAEVALSFPGGAV